MDAKNGTRAMAPEDHRPDEHGDYWLRLAVLEQQTNALLSAVADLAYAVEIMAFLSADPHAAVVLRRVKRSLAEVGVQIADCPRSYGRSAAASGRGVEDRPPSTVAVAVTPDLAMAPGEDEPFAVEPANQICGAGSGQLVVSGGPPLDPSMTAPMGA